MSTIALHIHCTSFMLDFLSEVDVWKYGQAIPSAEQAVESYWKRKKKIVVSEIQSPDVKILLHIIKLCKNLKELRLQTDDIIKELRNLPAIIAANCINIETLALNDAILCKEDLQVLCKCTTLRKLLVRFKAKDDVMKKLFLSLPRLEELTLYDQKGILKGDCLFALPKTIKSIELYSTSRLESRKLTQAIRSINSLEKIYITDLAGFDFNPGLASNLTEIYLRVHLLHINTVTNCKQLKRLHLSRQNEIGNGLIIALAEHCVLLETLHIEPISIHLTSQGLGHLGRLPKLRELYLGGHSSCLDCSQYTECMSNLSKCENLKRFSVASCGFTNFALWKMIKSCRELNHIAINNCNIKNDYLAFSLNEFKNQTNRKSVVQINLFTRSRVDLQKAHSAH